MYDINLKQVYKKFPTDESCMIFLETILWNGNPTCPYCKSVNYSKLKDGNRYHCNTCNTSYSVTVNTIFHRTRCDLQKWFLGIYLIYDLTREMSARELGDILELTKDSAWLMRSKVKSTLKENELLFLSIIEKIKS